MNIYENQRKIAIIVLVPIILLLLLSLHFKIWSGSYMEGDLESVVVHQIEVFKKGNTVENKKSIEGSVHLFDCIYLTGTKVIDCVHYVCGMFVCFAYCVVQTSITLCSLSVRMND